MNKSTRYNLGIIGVGGLAERRILPALASSEDFEVSCIFDIDPKRLEYIAGAFSIPKQVSSPDRFFSEHLDAVYIATPNYAHVPYAIEALKHDMAVLIEKPCAISSTSAEELLQAAKRAKRPALVAYMSKLNRYNQAVLGFVREKRIGKLLAMTASYGFCYNDMNAWRMHRDKSGPGALADIGVYAITTALDLFDEMPVSCSAQAFPAGNPVFGDRFLSGRIEFSGGRWLQVTASFVSPSHGYTLVGTSGVIHAEQTWGQDGKGEITICTEQGLEKIVSEEVNPYEEEFRCLKECLDGHPVPGNMSIERGAQDVKVMEALDRSAAQMGKETMIL